MNEEILNSDMPLREAAEGDIAILVQHHRRMFEEIWERRGEKIDSSSSGEMEKVYSEKLQLQLGDGTCKAWIIENNGNIVASGAVSIVMYVPAPQDLSCDIAYLHSMYTEKDHRNKLCATRIIDHALQYCKERGIKRIILNASEAGAPIYEKAGFRPASDMMRLLLE